MDEFDLQQLAEHPDWQRVLEAYREKLAAATKTSDGESSRWAPRIAEVPDLDEAELASVHGQLIAFGWLTFQLEDGRSGLRYRLSSEGETALQRLPAFLADREPEDAEYEERAA